MADDLNELLRQVSAATSTRQPQPQPESPQAVQHGANLHLFRLLQGPSATADDFKSNLAMCVPRRPAEDQDPVVWAGLSMYDSPQQAEQTARRYRGRPGRYLAEVLVPIADPTVIVRQTFKPGHFTVLCCETKLLNSLNGPVQPILGLSA